MKTCVYIIGSNLSGKSTTARKIIQNRGGVSAYKDGITYTNGNLALAGPYKEGHSHGGVDRLSGTGRLAGIVEQALKSVDIVICEGSYMDTFGLNLTNAIFKAEKQLVVHLYCDASTVYERSKTRPNFSGHWQRIIDRCHRVERAAAKWQEIGVPVIRIDTSVTTPEKAAQIIEERISRL